MHIPTNNGEPNVERLIADHFSRVKPGNWPLSVTRSSRSIRRAHPSLGLSDAELDQMVERYAVQHGLNVHFDHGSSQ